MTATDSTSRYHSDVCIVGAGPTGLLLAANLAQAGLRVNILEANRGHFTAFPALAHSPALFPEFREAGILEQARKASQSKSDWVHVRRATDHEIIDSIPPKPGRPGVMALPQSTLVSIMVDRLCDFDDSVQMLMGHQVIALMDNGPHSHVTLDVLAAETGLVKNYSCKYLVGADGSKSFVRRTLGLSYEGYTLPFKLIAADVFYPFEEYGRVGVNFLLDAESYGKIALVDVVNDHSLWRVSLGFSETMLNKEIIGALPKRYEIMFPRGKAKSFVYRHHSEPKSYEAHYFCVTKQRHGNVFLIGDAAHIANPYSGQVLSFAIFDASALSDYIAAVVKDKKLEKLFDEWSDDRIQKFKTILDPLARACFEAVSHPEIESIASRHPFLKAVHAKQVPQSLATRVEDLPSWNPSVAT